MARPKGFKLTEKQLEKVIARVYNGDKLRDIAADHDITHAALLYYIRKTKPDDYSYAQESYADQLAAETVSIADDPSIEPSRARNMINARNFILERRYAKHYGRQDKVQQDITSGGKAIMQPVINISLSEPKTVNIIDVETSEAIEDTKAIQ